MTDHDIVIKCFGCISKAGLVFCSVVDITSPTVRLDTNGDVDFRNI